MRASDRRQGRGGGIVVTVLLLLLHCSPCLSQSVGGVCGRDGNNACALIKISIEVLIKLDRGCWSMERMELYSHGGPREWLVG